MDIQDWAVWGLVGIAVGFLLWRLSARAGCGCGSGGCCGKGKAKP